MVMSNNSSSLDASLHLVTDFDFAKKVTYGLYLLVRISISLIKKSFSEEYIACEVVYIYLYYK